MAGLGLGALAVIALGGVVAVKALARSGGALKAMAAMRGLRKAPPAGTAGAH